MASILTLYLSLLIETTDTALRGGGRCVIAATSLCSQRERDILQRQLDLAHAQAKLNGGNVNEEESQDY